MAILWNKFTSTRLTINSLFASKQYLITISLVFSLSTHKIIKSNPSNCCIVSILLFMKNTKLTKEIVDKHIEKEFNVKIKEMKENTLEKRKFIKKFKEIYDKTFNLVMKKIR